MPLCRGRPHAVHVLDHTASSEAAYRRRGRFVRYRTNQLIHECHRPIESIFVQDFYAYDGLCVLKT